RSDADRRAAIGCGRQAHQRRRRDGTRSACRFPEMRPRNEGPRRFHLCARDGADQGSARSIRETLAARFRSRFIQIAADRFNRACTVAIATDACATFSLTGSVSYFTLEYGVGWY